MRFDQAERGSRHKGAASGARADEQAPVGVGKRSSPGGGSPLPEEVRLKMETAFGADFGGIRVYQDGRAEEMGAHAFAYGEELHFAPGKLDLSSEAGLTLLGHELAHVVQQRQGRVAPEQTTGDTAVNRDPALEAEADQLGARAARGEQVARHGENPASTSKSPVLQGYFHEDEEPETPLPEEQIELWLRRNCPALVHLLPKLRPLIEDETPRPLGTIRSFLPQLVLEDNGVDLTGTEAVTQNILSFLGPRDLQRTSESSTSLRQQSGQQHGTRLARTAPELIGMGRWVPSGSWTGSEGLKVVGKQVTLEGEQMFRAHDGSSGFLRWMFGGEAPGESSTMNCWEAVLFAAITAGIVDFADVQALYAKAGEAARAKFLQRFPDGEQGAQAFDRRYAELFLKMRRESEWDHSVYLAEKELNDVVAQIFGVERQQRWDGISPIPRGTFVFFGTWQNHTAISLGGDRVLTLWPRDQIAEMTIQEVIEEGKIEGDKAVIWLSRPPWL